MEVVGEILVVGVGVHRLDVPADDAKRSFITLSGGTIALVVQLAADSTVSSSVRVSWLTP